MTRHRETRIWKWGDFWDDHGMNDASKAVKKDGTHPRTKSGSKSRKCQKLGVFSSDIYLGCSAVNYHQKPHITSYYHVFATSEDIILPGPFAQLTIGVPLTPLSANNGPLALRPGSHVMNSPGYEVVTWTQKSEPHKNAPELWYQCELWSMNQSIPTSNPRYSVSFTKRCKSVLVLARVSSGYSVISRVPCPPVALFPWRVPGRQSTGFWWHPTIHLVSCGAVFWAIWDYWDYMGLCENQWTSPPNV